MPAGRRRRKENDPTVLEKLLGRYAYMLMKAFAAGVVMVYNFITRKLVLEKNK